MSTKPIEDCAPACEGCGNDEEGLALAEYEDPGDPSVGYGPIKEVLCDSCADKRLGVNALD